MTYESDPGDEQPEPRIATAPFHTLLAMSPLGRADAHGFKERYAADALWHRRRDLIALLDEIDESRA